MLVAKGSRKGHQVSLVTSGLSKLDSLNAESKLRPLFGVADIRAFRLFVSDIVGVGTVDIGGNLAMASMVAICSLSTFVLCFLASFFCDFLRLSGGGSEWLS